MLVQRVIQYVYDAYDRGRFLRGFHQRFTASKVAARFFFGVDLWYVPRQYLFDLTTVLLRRILEGRINSSKDVLEIGVGKFAILSTSLSKSCNVAIDGVDINHQCVEYARDCVARNKARVTVWQSDVFKSIPVKAYDVIFRNLPYRGPMWRVSSGYDRVSYLHPLFEDAAAYLKKDGALIIGFNANAIAIGRVLEILAQYETLVVREVKSWRWNKHCVLVIERADGRDIGP